VLRLLGKHEQNERREMAGLAAWFFRHRRFLCAEDQGVD
jgi:hypothetical protein